MKTDTERRSEVLKRKQESKEGNPAGFFDKKAEEFQDILKSIEKVKIHKLVGQARGGSGLGVELDAKG